MAIDSPYTGAPSGASLNPSAWLTRFETLGGAFAMTPNGLYLWIIPADRSEEQLGRARKMAKTLRPDQRTALENHLNAQVGKSRAEASTITPLPCSSESAGATGEIDQRSEEMNMMTVIKANASAATITALPRTLDGGAAAWKLALTDFRAKLEFEQGIPADDPRSDLAVLEMCNAMDHLIENVPAPDASAVNIKLELARERSADMLVLFEDHRNAIIRDLRRLAGETEIEIAATPERGSHAFCDDEHGLFDHLPDLRTGRSLADAFRHLDLVAQIDPAAYPAEWDEEIRDVAGFASVNYPKVGARYLGVGQPCDKQMQERRRRVDALCEHMRAVDGRYECVCDYLERLGNCTDNRPRDMRETTTALREFVSAGFRVFLRPDGRLDESRGLPREWLEASAERAEQILSAARRYAKAKRRHRNQPQIGRAVRMLGKLGSNGFIVLQREEY
jgi:hypothetical protein